MLWNIARYQPEHLGDLARAGMKLHVRQRCGEEGLTLIADAAATADNAWPEALSKPLSPEAGELLKKLKKVVTAHAELLDIPADMLAKKKTLEALLRSGYPRGPYALPEPLQGWRKDEIVNGLLVALAPAETSTV